MKWPCTLTAGPLGAAHQHSGRPANVPLIPRSITARLAVSCLDGRAADGPVTSQWGSVVVCLPFPPPHSYHSFSQSHSTSCTFLVCSSACWGEFGQRVIFKLIRMQAQPPRAKQEVEGGSPHLFKNREVPLFMDEKELSAGTVRTTWWRVKEL